ncbi:MULTISPECIES: TetR/AcrR family transcriptional regulator [Pseudomonas]|uniref:Transcriptional regulator n=1 Tax=Pseudomonas oryziphila TaxID=2894079 RepID=A0ABM7CRE6_9PSED|nr:MULTISPECIES: transcriptional regulator [Pseudomonas]AZL74020.1 transcriptional regulator [Pseudomonas oryziphila]
MHPTPHDERLLKALANAMVVHPRATLKELAETAGVSKATLHRFCGTRDNLIEMLENHGEQVLNQVIRDADLTQVEPLPGLRHLIAEHLKHREMLAFLMFQYRPDTLLGDSEDRRWHAYTQAMDAFFLRAQQLGALRIDISAAVFTEMFLSMIFSMVDAERRGRAASATSALTLEQLFVHGAQANI